MRAREMMARLDRLPKRRAWKDRRIPDFSLLTPEKQDRVSELLRQIKTSDDAQFTVLYDELGELARDLPLIGPDDPYQGLLIEVPGELYDYWQWQQPTSQWRSFDFHKLGKVQTLRFVTLCQKYGFEDGVEIRAQMLPLNGWELKDRAELQEMLDIAASEDRNALDADE